MDSRGAGAGAGAGAPAEGPSLRTFQATIRYVLNNGAGTTLDSFTWAVVPPGRPKTVYRAQAGASTKGIEGDRSTPLEIRTDRGRPISTSSMLTSKIETFAEVPEGSGAEGRIFAIELQPDVRYASLQDQIPEEAQAFDKKTGNLKTGKARARADALTEEAFAFLDDELPVGHRLKGTGIPAQSAMFFNFLTNEREILLDPRAIQFVSDPKTKTPETWSKDRPLVPEQSFDLTKKGKRIETEDSKAKGKRPVWEKEFVSHPVAVYKTYAIPKAKGGRRTRKHRRPGTRKHRRHQ